MTQFKVGDRVRVKSSGKEEVVNGISKDDFVSVISGGQIGSFYYRSYELEPIEPVLFYMLLVDGTEPCGQRYATIEEARTEAKRLLHEPRNQGKGITILRAVEYGRLPETEIEWRAIE